MYIPHDIYVIITDFVYGFKLKQNIYSSLLHQVSARRLIPDIFLNEKVPIKKYCCNQNEHVLRHIDCFSLPNPFKGGNPWVPTPMLQTKQFINVEFLYYVVDLLHDQAIKNIRTRKHYLQKAISHLNTYCTSGFLWNFKYHKLLALFSDRDNFRRDLSETDSVIIHRITKQVSNVLGFWVEYHLF